KNTFSKKQKHEDRERESSIMPSNSSDSTNASIPIYMSPKYYKTCVCRIAPMRISPRLHVDTFENLNMFADDTQLFNKRASMNMEKIVDTYEKRRLRNDKRKY
ncbi:Hypothetical predicted protein, partial [Mytilus galloprovincialis]